MTGWFVVFSSLFSSLSLYPQKVHFWYTIPHSMNRKETIFNAGEGFLLIPETVQFIFTKRIDWKFILTIQLVAVFPTYMTHEGGAILCSVDLAQVIDGGRMIAFLSLPNHPNPLVRILGFTDTIELSRTNYNNGVRDYSVSKIRYIIRESEVGRLAEVERADDRGFKW